jgi:glutaredoxin
MPPPATTVTLFGKPDCHLCDDARAAVVEALEGRPVELREVDISRDPSLLRSYGERIPVVEIGGEERFRYFVDVDALRRIVDELQRRSAE